MTITTHVPHNNQYVSLKSPDVPYTVYTFIGTDPKGTQTQACLLMSDMYEDHLNMIYCPCVSMLISLHVA